MDVEFVDITSKGHLPSVGRMAGFWNHSVGCDIRVLRWAQEGREHEIVITEDVGEG